ncbi:hypothetical protein PR202_ga04569 [Eleusine coracana subsp. coracana]|uniref:Uncharacterized protein n=1 Tax=Eleusine coracana subsp. coracana TaxID=191504 RepID=A0AAV5BQ71_ELECO|nr:hypothetical protein PR202_ga04569 [Eleusine coracana subsp. coracana]
MSPSLALAHSLSLSLALPHRCSLPSSRSRGLAPNRPLLGAHRPLLIRAPQRPLLTPRRFAFAVKSSANGEGDGGAGTGRKGAGYRNRFLDLARLGAVAESAAEAFFRSEIRRRLTITAALIVLSRVGYFIPLPGFDRRLIPDSYLSFAPLPADDLGDFSSELKLSFFQLGISHQISASIVMQVRLKPFYLLYRWWLSLVFATVAAFTVSCYSLQYSIYAASYRVKHIIITSFLLVLGAMSMTWICDTISESGFGNTLSPAYLSIFQLASRRQFAKRDIRLPKQDECKSTKDKAWTSNSRISDKDTNINTFLGYISLKKNNGVILNVMNQVGSIIELRRSYQAYNVMPALSKVLRRYGA